MLLKNTLIRYGAIAKTLHWLIAILIIGMLGVGLYMVDLPDNPQKWEIYALHKAIGILVLGLASLRLIWRLCNIQPLLLVPNLEKFAAHAMHWGLYFFMFAMPLTGWFMSTSGGHEVSFFGLFNMPVLIEKNQTYNDFFAFAHEYLAYVLIAALVIHVLGALKHYFYNKDDIMQRML